MKLFNSNRSRSVLFKKNNTKIKVLKRDFKYPMDPCKDKIDTPTFGDIYDSEMKFSRAPIFIQFPSFDINRGKRKRTETDMKTLFFSGINLPYKYDLNFKSQY